MSKYVYSISKSSAIPVEGNDYRGCKYFGNLFYKYEGKAIWMDIFEVDGYDINSVAVKKNCKLFRYRSDATRISDYFPIVMINLDKGLIYFWNDDLNYFESVGIKLKWFCQKDWS